MSEMIDTISNYLTLFDIIYAVITLLTVIQCSKKGFTLSLLSTSKWILAIVITIIAVPKLKPWADNYIKSEYVVDIGLGIIIFLLAIFIILLVSRGISKVVKYSVDWWNTLHQPSSITLTSAPTIHYTMLIPLIIMFIGMIIYALIIFLMKYKLEIIKL